MRPLLDVNVLLALLDADHVDHRRARDWLGTFATFDGRVPLEAVAGATREHLVVV